MSKGTRRERECSELYQQAGFATYRPATRSTVGGRLLALPSNTPS